MFAMAGSVFKLACESRLHAVVKAAHALCALPWPPRCTHPIKSTLARLQVMQRCQAAAGASGQQQAAQHMACRCSTAHAATQQDPGAAPHLLCDVALLDTHVEVCRVAAVSCFAYGEWWGTACCHGPCTPRYRACTVCRSSKLGVFKHSQDMPGCLISCTMTPSCCRAAGPSLLLLGLSLSTLHRATPCIHRT